VNSSLPFFPEEQKQDREGAIRSLCKCFVEGPEHHDVPHPGVLFNKLWIPSAVGPCNFHAELLVAAYLVVLCVFLILDLQENEVNCGDHRPFNSAPI
jgi:hypothetical protein